MRVWDIKDNKVLHTNIDGLGNLSSTLSMRDRNTLVYEKLDDETEKQNDRSRIKTPLVMMTWQIWKLMSLGAPATRS